MYKVDNAETLAMICVRNGESFDQFISIWRRIFNLDCTEREKASMLVEIYFDAKDEYEDTIGEMSEGLQERISDLTAYIDFIRLKGGKRFTQDTIDKILADNSLKIIDKDSGA